MRTMKPNFKLIAPDGVAENAILTYKGEPMGAITSITIKIEADKHFVTAIIEVPNIEVDMAFIDGAVELKKD